MSNEYFSYNLELIPGTKARAEDINNLFKGLVVGLDRLPAPAPEGTGFGDPVTIAAATELTHAVSAQQIIYGEMNYGIDSGTENAFIVTMAIAPASYRDGLLVYFAANTTTSGAATVNVNGLGVKQVLKNYGGQLSPGDIGAGDIVVLIYSGTAFKCITIREQFTVSPVFVKNLTAPFIFTDSLLDNDHLVMMLTGGAQYGVTWPAMTWVSDYGNGTPGLTNADFLVFWKVGAELFGKYVGSFS